MGLLCSKISAVDKSPSESTPHDLGFREHRPKSCGSGLKARSDSSPPIGEEAVGKQFDEEPFSFSNGTVAASQEPKLSTDLSQKSGSTKLKAAAAATKTGTKVSEMSSLLGRAGTAGLEKAVEVLDTLGSSMTSLHLNNSFVSGVAAKGNKISILAFEVANTIVKGANLLQSLSEENVKHLKEVVLPSEGVHHLISKDMDELLRIAAADKREELKIFSGEVIRFGNRCKDPQWHNLNRYFDKLDSEFTPKKQLKEAAETMMHQLMISVQFTADLYHELHALDRFEQDYRRKHQEEEDSTAVQGGDTLHILRQELKSQRKHVKNLKKKSLWSKNLEEVMGKLVEIVHFLHLEIHDSFGSADGDKSVKGPINVHIRLGSAGLALHYANIICQIDTLVPRSSSVPPSTRDTLYQGLPPSIKCSLRAKLQMFQVPRSSSVPPSTRDTLYQGLPPSIKCSLRAKLQMFQVSEELTAPEIKAEMEKTLRWLVPIANNTTKAHHGFGWVGEWANTGSELNRKPAGQSDLIRIETLYHAHKEKTEAYILDLVVWLHHLISHSRTSHGGFRSPIKSPIRSPIQKGLLVSLPPANRPRTQSMLTQEDQQMLCDVTFRKLTPGISKSQEFDTAKSRSRKHNRLSKSSSHSPISSNKKETVPLRRPSMVPVINFDIDRLKALDVIDRVDVDDLRKL